MQFEPMGDGLRLQREANQRVHSAAIRLEPKLEIPGYGCEDHFLELNTVNHSYEGNENWSWSWHRETHVQRCRMREQLPRRCQR